MQLVFNDKVNHKNLDYVCAFIYKAKRNIHLYEAAALVSTSSVIQGSHVPTLWPHVISDETRITFAHRPFRWVNNAADRAGVYVVIIGISNIKTASAKIYEGESVRRVDHINPYLIKGNGIIVSKRSSPLSDISRMITGNAAYDQQHLRLTREEAIQINEDLGPSCPIIRRAYGTSEINSSGLMQCLWISDEYLDRSLSSNTVRDKIRRVNHYRMNGGDVARSIAARSHQFRFTHEGKLWTIAVPQVISGAKDYFPPALLDRGAIITHLAHAMYDAPIFNAALLQSRIHFVWTELLSGRHGSGLRYNSNLCWNTFPIPTLTTQNKADLTTCANNILLARERYFPATIADMYDPNRMDTEFPEVRRAHERNDEVLERIYIGRRFRNDTERLEKLFEMYAEMVGAEA